MREACAELYVSPLLAFTLLKWYKNLRKARGLLSFPFFLSPCLLPRALLLDFLGRPCDVSSPALSPLRSSSSPSQSSTPSSDLLTSTLRAMIPSPRSVLFFVAAVLATSASARTITVSHRARGNGCVVLNSNHCR